MHEFSLMDSILTTVESAAKEAGASRVTQIDLLVGELAQVMDEAMTFAFEALSEDTICDKATLNLKVVRPKSRCDECGCEFEHDVFHRRCPKCDSPSTVLIAGKELLIDKIEVDIDDDEDANGINSTDSNDCDKVCNNEL